MFHGRATERSAFIITIGNLPPAAYGRHSAMYSSPWDDVAVNTRTPAADAPMAQDIAECSDSTWMKFESSSPSATISDNLSTTTV